MSIPKTLHCLADAIEALQGAYEASDGFVGDHILAAERECYKALDQLVRSQHNFSREPGTPSAPAEDPTPKAE